MDLWVSWPREKKRPAQNQIQTNTSHCPTKTISKTDAHSLNTCRSARFFWKRRQVPSYHTSCALPLTALPSAPLADWHEWEIAALILNERLFQDTSFFLLIVETKRVEHTGPSCYVLLRYILKALTRQSNILSLYSSTESPRDGIVNSSNCGSCTDGFWVQSMKLGSQEKVQDLHSHQVIYLVGKTMQFVNPSGRHQS